MKIGFKVALNIKNWFQKYELSVSTAKAFGPTEI